MIVLGALLLSAFTLTNAIHKLPYNRIGTCDLKVGLWAWPMVMDWNLDGRPDLVVNSMGCPSRGVFVFLNPDKKDAKRKMPVFPPGRMIFDSYRSNSFACELPDGKIAATVPEGTFWDFRKGSFRWTGDYRAFRWPKGKEPKHQPFAFDGATRLFDWDGDGIVDRVVACGDFAWAKNTGGHGKKAVFGDLVKIPHSNGKPMRLWMSMPGNWDGDGDWDLIALDGYEDRFKYVKNDGTRTDPKYTLVRPLCDATGRPIQGDLCMLRPCAYDWDGDGDLDIICGEEDGRVSFIENEGIFTKDGVPVFRQPKYFRQLAEDLGFGCLTQPFVVDWDGDGDLDIISGNSAGYVGFIENLSGPEMLEPTWAEPVCLKAGGRTIRHQAGETGSIQGCWEAKWGYTNVSVADWDGDGFLDVMVNDVWGYVVWYRNPGKKGACELEPARPVEVAWTGKPQELAWGQNKPKGNGLMTQWRSTPLMFDWNRDGLVDLVAMDAEGYLAFYERTRKDGRLVLLPPQRLFKDAATGEALRLNDKSGGYSGRYKFCFCDWDGDGRLDLVTNTGLNSRGNATVWLQEDENVFRKAGNVSPTPLEGHSACPSVCDFDGDGIPDILIGAEDGFFWLCRNPRSPRSSIR